ncbi:aminopeptidase P family protein [bacterium]|nr:MAG: aminopeptidase P family protein [bacterium]
MIFPRDEYENRWALLQAQLKKRGYSTAVFWQRTGGSYDGAGDVYYLTNYASLASGLEPNYGGAAVVGRGLAALIVRVGAEPELHTAEPVSVLDRDEIACGQVFGHDSNLAIGLANRLKELGIEGPVANQGEAVLPVELYRYLIAATPAIEWVPENALLYELQSHKSPRELDVFRTVGEISSRALTTLMESLIKGERECDAAAKAASIIISAGGGFQRVMCHHGAKSEHAFLNNPLYGYSMDAPEPGDIVRGFVYGPIFGGYWIDPGRTAVCGGKPNAEQKKLIEDCVAIVNGVVGALRPGITGKELGAVGDRLIQDFGYADDVRSASTWELYGHSLSTYWLPPMIPAFGNISEARRVGWRVEEPFHAGQVCTVEFFIQKPGVGTATTEHVVILQPGGVEHLTTTPMIFW